MVPPTSVDTVQLKFTCVLLAAVAVRLLGAEGVAAGVDAVAVDEYGPRLLAASVARTR
jgi:hypothetical protein